jgi:hypothetical protein
MSAPGWYPDPGGAPGQFRYWDGTTWSPTTSPTPGTPPTEPGNKKPPIGLFIGIAAGVLALALIAVLLILNPFKNTDITDGPVDTSTPTQTSWNETSKPTTPPPTGKSATPTNPQPTGGTNVNCAVGNPNQRTSDDRAGKLTGGGLVVNQVPGWTLDSAPMGISYAYDVQSQSKQIAIGWMSNLAVGAVKKSDGFTDVQRSAEIAMQCMASSGFYTGFQRREDLDKGSRSVSGHNAYAITANIYVTGQEPIKGDLVTVIVVDTGNPDYFGIYFGIATIDDPGVALVKTATASLAVA